MAFGRFHRMLKGMLMAVVDRRHSPGRIVEVLGVMIVVRTNVE